MYFHELESPAEYNFVTDRIFVALPTETVTKLLTLVDYQQWSDQVKAAFTSRSGFSSYYSNNLCDWLDAGKPLDHNQLGSLLLTITEQYAQEEYESLCCHGLENASEIAEEYVWRV